MHNVEQNIHYEINYLCYIDIEYFAIPFFMSTVKYLLSDHILSLN